MAESLNKNPTCFVLMPISDADGYEKSHFERVYKHLITPACEKSGYQPVRADDVFKTNYIIVDILRKIIDSEMVLCDISNKNPNVLYELGIRQAFNKPVVLIKDFKTEKIFDIQGLRYTEYDHNLRIDMVNKNIEEIAKNILETSKMKAGEINSLIQLLSIRAATIANPTEISGESKLILDAIAELGLRVSKMETKKQNDGENPDLKALDSKKKYSINNEVVSLGDRMFGAPNHTRYRFVGAKVGAVVLQDEEGKLLEVKHDSEIFKSLSSLPF
jgi:hypothetical protein